MAAPKTSAKKKRANQKKYKAARKAFKLRSRPEIAGRYVVKGGKITGRFDTGHTTYTRSRGKKGRTA